MPNPALLQRVEELLMADSFVADFEDFARKNCGEFEDSEENKLSYTIIYNDFLALFTNKFESVLAATGTSQQEFEVACMEETDKESFFIQLLLSITSFDQFKQLMVYQKQNV